MDNISNVFASDFNYDSHLHVRSSTHSSSDRTDNDRGSSSSLQGKFGCHTHHSGRKRLKYNIHRMQLPYFRRLPYDYN